MLLGSLAIFSAIHSSPHQGLRGPPHSGGHGHRGPSPPHFEGSEHGPPHFEGREHHRLPPPHFEGSEHHGHPHSEGRERHGPPHFEGREHHGGLPRFRGHHGPPPPMFGGLFHHGPPPKFTANELALFVCHHDARKHCPHPHPPPQNVSDIRTCLQNHSDDLHELCKTALAMPPSHEFEGPPHEGPPQEAPPHSEGHHRGHHHGHPRPPPMEVMLGAFCSAEKVAVCSHVPRFHRLEMLMCLNRHRKELAEPCAAVVPKHPIVGFALHAVAHLAVLLLFFAGVRFVYKACLRRRVGDGKAIYVDSEAPISEDKVNGKAVYDCVAVL